MSNEKRQDLIEEVVREVAEFQSAAELVDEAAAERLGVNRTDQRCMGMLSVRGPMSAGALARASGLSAGAMTTALDRLERVCYIQRVRSADDRRSVLVELTPEAGEVIAKLYGPVARAGRARLERYREEELILLRDFLRMGSSLQAEHAARLRDEGAPTASTSD